MSIGKMWLRALVVLGLLLSVSSGYAHTPLCSCYDNGDGTVTCEGGFSDGSSAAGVGMKVLDAKGNVLLRGSMSEFSEYTFDKPDQDYTVLFDAGEGHSIQVKSTEILE